MLKLEVTPRGPGETAQQPSGSSCQLHSLAVWRKVEKKRAQQVPCPKVVGEGEPSPLTPLPKTSAMG